jgi:hypothetical protein
MPRRAEDRYVIQAASSELSGRLKGFHSLDVESAPPVEPWAAAIAVVLG